MEIDNDMLAGLKSYSEIKKIFEQANVDLLKKDNSLFENKVSERTLCGALMLRIYDRIKDDISFHGYYADVEYNRNSGSVKTIIENRGLKEEKIIRINCDLILHSRGHNVRQDNLLAIEMKKSTRRSVEKEKDKDRLKALTKDPYGDTWPWECSRLPEHVCGYVMGVYYEINYRRKQISIEYYHKGKLEQAIVIGY